MGECKSAEGFCLEIPYVNLPISCGISTTQCGKFQSIPFCVKIQDAIEFKNCFKFVLQHNTTSPASSSKNAFSMLMQEAGRQMWPDKQGRITEVYSTTASSIFSRRKRWVGPKKLLSGPVETHKPLRPRLGPPWGWARGAYSILPVFWVPSHEDKAPSV